MAKISELPAELIHRIIEQAVESVQHQCPHHHHHHHHLEHDEAEETPTPAQQEDNQQDNPRPNNIPTTQTNQNNNNQQRNRTAQQHHPHHHQNENRNLNGNGNRDGNENRARNPVPALNINPNNFAPFNITDFSLSFTATHAGEFGLPTSTDYLDPEEDEDEPQVSWPDGLPSDPLVIFSLINRTFQECAQERLYKHVALYTQWQASLFLRTLNRSRSDCLPVIQDQPASATDSIDIKGKRRAQFDGNQVSAPRIYRRLNRLGDHVRSLRFEWMGPASMGKGGGSLICDILMSCPQLENIAISTTLLKQCKEPLFRALERRTMIKEFLILKTPVETPRKFLWGADEVLTRFFTKWDSLKTIELIGLSGMPLDRMESVLRSIPSFTCTLREISLTCPNLAEIEIAKILSTSKATMNSLRITCPSPKLDRKGLYRILKDYTSPDLESLSIHVSKDWHPINPGRGSAATIAESSSDPNQNPHLLDILFKSSSMRNLKSLSIGGPLASSKVFPLLPETIVKLAWEDCTAIQPGSFAKFLSSWSNPSPLDPAFSTGPLNTDSLAGEQTGKGLPDLKCCSVGTDDFHWKRADRRAVEKALKERNACFHSSNCQALFPPAWFRPPSDGEDEETPSNFGGGSDGGEANEDPDWDIPSDNNDDESEEESRGGGSSVGANGPRNQLPPGFMPPPPMLFPGLFGMPMGAYSFPFTGGIPGPPSPEGTPAAWLFGTPGLGGPAPPRPPANTAGSANSTRTQSSRSNTNQSTRNIPSTGTQSRAFPASSNRTDTPQGQTRSNQAGPSSSSTTATTTHATATTSTTTPATGDSSSSSSSTRRPKSPGLFGPDFKFRKMFD
ncbi:hypothetical protein MJO29_003970 [Puccinia striiformis f. sp. tritici]|nr:hypothetical protein MJO29_003970 [Puccinia striiformis f. sp. tritici]